MKNNWFQIRKYQPNQLPLHHTNKQTKNMETSNITIGTKFKTGHVKKDGSLSELSGEYRVYEVTNTRVCYTDGTKSSCGSSNRKQAGNWLTVKGFEKRLKLGTIEII